MVGPVNQRPPQPLPGASRAEPTAPAEGEPPAAPPAPPLPAPSTFGPQRAAFGATTGDSLRLPEPSRGGQRLGLFGAPVGTASSAAASTPLAGAPQTTAPAAPATTPAPPPPPPRRSVAPDLVGALDRYGAAKDAYDAQRAAPLAPGQTPETKYAADLDAYRKLARSYEGTVQPGDLSTEDRAAYDALPEKDTAARDAFLKGKSPNVAGRYWAERAQAKKAGELLMTHAPSKPKEPPAPAGTPGRPTPDQRIETAAKLFEAKGLSEDAAKVRALYAESKVNAPVARPALEALGAGLEAKGFTPEESKAVQEHLTAGGKRLSTVPDYLEAARRTQVTDPRDHFKAAGDPARGQPVPGYGFTPERADEATFKANFAAEATRLGLTGDLVTGVYALETGGDGTADMQTLNRDGTAVSSALGYAQLLGQNSTTVMLEHGEAIAQRLDAGGKPEKAALVRAMAADAKAFALEAKRAAAGSAAATERYAGVAKALEDKGLTADAAEVRRLATAAKDTPDASWKELAGLATALEGRGEADAAKALKAANTATESAYDAWSAMGTLARYEKGKAMHAANIDKDIGPLMQATKLRDAYRELQARGVQDITPAKLELANLAGAGTAAKMLKPENADVPTSNYFDQSGYQDNPMVRMRSVSELLKRIDQVITEGRALPGTQEFERAFR